MRRVRSIFILSLLLILAGVALTLENVGIIIGASRLWPVFLLILGGGFIILFLKHRRRELSLIFLGTTITLLGLFFFYFNFTTWSHMATMWPTFLGIAGAGFFAMYLNGRQNLFFFLAVALVMLAAVFYLVFGISLQLWPLSLVAFGASLLLADHYYR
jgi:hypothetical protein